MTAGFVLCGSAARLLGDRDSMVRALGASALHSLVTLLAHDDPDELISLIDLGCDDSDPLVIRAGVLALAAGTEVAHRYSADAVLQRLLGCQRCDAHPDRLARWRDQAEFELRAVWHLADAVAITVDELDLVQELLCRSRVRRR